MKTYRLVLSIGGATYVEADNHVEEDGMLRFFRDGHLLSEFPRASVLNVQESAATNQGILFTKWLHEDKEPAKEG
ncbi:MAG: hypothetical protein ACAH88_05960 [Roseimicrobium sp.]